MTYDLINDWNIFLYICLNFRILAVLLIISLCNTNTMGKKGWKNNEVVLAIEDSSTANIEIDNERISAHQKKLEALYKNFENSKKV